MVEMHNYSCFLQIVRAQLIVTSNQPLRRNNASENSRVSMLYQLTAIHSEPYKLNGFHKILFETTVDSKVSNDIKVSNMTNLDDQ